MPGKIVSPERIRAIRFSLSSSLVLRARSLCSEKVLFLSSPKVVGRFMKGPLALIIRLDSYVPIFDERDAATIYRIFNSNARGRCCWLFRERAYSFPAWGWRH